MKSLSAVALVLALAGCAGRPLEIRVEEPIEEKDPYVRLIDGLERNAKVKEFELGKIYTFSDEMYDVTVIDVVPLRQFSEGDYLSGYLRNRVTFGYEAVRDNNGDLMIVFNYRDPWDKTSIGSNSHALSGFIQHLENLPFHKVP